MLQVSITLASGRSEILSILQSSKVQDLRILAQKSLGQGFLKLVPASGQVLPDHTESLDGAGIQDGDHLMTIALQARLATTLELVGGFKHFLFSIINMG
jgi:hypothetical protein